MSRFTPPYLGAAYYPEDWPREQVKDDIALMQEIGINVARVGEFAWSCMEPEEGRYDFTWLHQVVEQLAAAGIATIMCTPTCTPPAWLSERYPEILLMRGDGSRLQHGGRRHACPNHPVYRAHCARITQRMAEEFGQHASIIGWQIDNELYPHDRGCHCPVCHRLFQDAMRARFGEIEALNRAWGTHLWSQTYQSFAQLPLPRENTWHHPSLVTAWLNFQSDSYVAFAEAQAAILHASATQPVGTDMMPFNGLNYHKIHRTLDLVQFNHYFQMDTLWQVAFWMDNCRALKPHPFWNTETSTCWNGSTAAREYKEPGFCRVNSWLPIALGGEANLYWLWRAHWSGQELMHGSVVSSAGRYLHVTNEVKEVAAGFRAAATFLNSARPTPPGLALHLSGFAWNFFAAQPIAGDFTYTPALLEHVYRPLQQAQLRLDVIDPAAELDAYRVICSPFLPTLDESGIRDRLRAWIEAGGIWVAGPLTDIRTEHATKFTYAPYGSLEEWAGVYCKYEIPGIPRDFALQWADGADSTGSIWYDALEPRGAEVLAHYTEGPMRGLAAVTRRRLGRGQVILLGTMPPPADYQRLLLSLCAEAGIAPAATASPNLLVVPRAGEAGRGLVAIELEHRSGTLTLPTPMTDLLTGEQHCGEITLAPYRVMVLQED